MAFKRTTTKTFRAEVKVPVANDAGGYDDNSFTAVFEHCTSTEQEALRGLTNTELIKRKLKGWELVDAETKEAVPFTPENLEAILQIPPSPMKIAVAFWEQVNGARAKNS
jgi:hypothetical protein